MNLSYDRMVLSDEPCKVTGIIGGETYAGSDDD